MAKRTRGGYIYLIRNKANGKEYVGQTTGSVQARWLQHLNDAQGGSELLIHKAIRKYPPESFEVLVLERVARKADLSDREGYYMKQRQTMTPNGYNLVGPAPLRISSQAYRDSQAVVATEIWSRPEFREKRAQLAAQRAKARKRRAAMLRRAADKAPKAPV